MKWIFDLLSSRANLPPSLFEKFAYILRHREIRNLIFEKITQQHREGIMLIIWSLPKDFDARCKESLQLLSETANVAARFNEGMYKDIKDTSNIVHSLLQIHRLFDNPDMTPQTRRELTEKQDTIKIDLIRKLHRL